MKKKKVTAPVYDTMADNEFITGLREDLGDYRGLYNQALAGLDYTSPELQNLFQNIANDYTQAQWSDYNRNAAQQMKALNQANYARYGSLGTSAGIYGTDTYQRSLNDLASRIAGQTAGQYQNLMDTAYNQRLAAAQLYGNAYGNAGQSIYSHDQQNWNIGNINKEAKYLADVQNAQNSGGWSWGNMLSGAVSGAMSGSSAGPWGALAGGIVGAGLGGASGYFGGDGNSAAQMGSNIGGLFSNYLNSRATTPSTTGGLNLNTKANSIGTPRTSYSGYVGF